MFRAPSGKLFRFFIDPLGSVLGIDDLLLTVKTIISRQGIGHATGQREHGQSLTTEELIGQQDGTQGAVGGTAEHGGH